MKLLLDTHTFLWFVSGSDKLSKTAKELISNSEHEHFISIASLWEISIKTAIGKLKISGPYDTVINDVEENGIEVVPINFPHTVLQNKLPFHHKDPFDRIIVAQAITESMTFISKDEVFDKYLLNSPLKRVW